MGLDDPTKKMSKSEDSPGHSVLLLDSPDEIRPKIMRATTDSNREICFDEKRPGIYNLLVIYEIFTGISRLEIEAKFEGKGYAVFKKDLAEVIIEGLKPLQSRYKEMTSDANYIDSILTRSADNLRPIAEKTLITVKEKMGLG
jgi:tryptophanyl-tRNA synthetase